MKRKYRIIKEEWPQQEMFPGLGHRYFSSQMDVFYPQYKYKGEWEYFLGQGSQGPFRKNFLNLEKAQEFVGFHSKTADPEIVWEGIGAEFQ